MSRNRIIKISLTLAVLALIVIVNRSQDADFMAFYNAGARVVRGHAADLYSVAGYPVTRPFIRPAWEALVFAPFGAMPYRMAFVAWDTVSLLLFSLSIWLIRDGLNGTFREGGWKSLAVPAVLLPAGLTLSIGQDTALFLFLVVLSVKCLQASRDWDAGICLGLASIDIHLIFPVMVLMAFRCKWKVLEAVMATGLGLLLLSFAVGGPGWIVSCLHAQATMQHEMGFQTARYALTLAGLGNISVGLLLLAAIVVSFYLVRNLPLEVAMAWIILAAVFFNWHSSFYDYVVAILPLSLPERGSEAWAQ